MSNFIKKNCVDSDEEDFQIKIPKQTSSTYL